MAGVSVPESGGARGKKSLDLEIPLVPFIDLLCSLIVFLLMTAVWTQIARLELKQGNAAPPDPNQTPPPEKEKTVDLRLELHEKGFTLVENQLDEVGVIVCTTSPCWKEETTTDKEGKQVKEIKSSYDYKALEEKLKELKAKHGDQQKQFVVLSADDVPYQEMIKTMDTAIVAGMEGISVSGTPL